MYLRIKCNRDTIWGYAKDNYPDYPNIDDDSLDDLMLLVDRIEECEMPHINQVLECLQLGTSLILCRDEFCERGYLVAVDSFDDVNVLVTLITPFS